MSGFWMLETPDQVFTAEPFELFRVDDNIRRVRATGKFASISGGVANDANGDFASVSGGQDNNADGNVSSISGGSGNNANGGHASILGGNFREILDGTFFETDIGY